MISPKKEKELARSKSPERSAGSQLRDNSRELKDNSRDLKYSANRRTPSRESRNYGELHEQQQNSKVKR